MTQTEFETLKTIITESETLRLLAEKKVDGLPELKAVLKNRMLGDYVDSHLKDGANLIDMYITIYQATHKMIQQPGIIQTFWNSAFDTLVDHPDHAEEERE